MIILPIYLLQRLIVNIFYYGIYYIFMAGKSMINLIINIITFIKNAIWKIFDLIFSFIKMIWSSISKFFEKYLSNFFNLIFGYIIELWKIIINIWEKIMSQFLKIGNFFKNIFNFLSERFKWFFSKIYDIFITPIINLFSKIKKGIEKMANYIIEKILLLLKGTKYGIGWIFSKIWSGIKFIFNGIVNGISFIFNTIFKLFIKIIEWLEIIFNNFKKIFQNSFFEFIHKKIILPSMEKFIKSIVYIFEMISLAFMTVKIRIFVPFFIFFKNIYSNLKNSFLSVYYYLKNLISIIKSFFK
jgi:hypothetical protein